MTGQREPERLVERTDADDRALAELLRRVSRDGPGAEDLARMMSGVDTALTARKRSARQVSMRRGLWLVSAFCAVGWLGWAARHAEPVADASGGPGVPASAPEQTRPHGPVAANAAGRGAASTRGTPLADEEPSPPAAASPREPAAPAETAAQSPEVATAPASAPASASLPPAGKPALKAPGRAPSPARPAVAPPLGASPGMPPTPPFASSDDDAQVGGPAGGRRESELGLLARAQEALPQRPLEALSALRSHALAYPDGMYVQERDALRCDALALLRQTSELRACATAFLQDHPRSPHGTRVARYLDR